MRGHAYNFTHDTCRELDTINMQCLIQGAYIHVNCSEESVEVVCTADGKTRLRWVLEHFSYKAAGCLGLHTRGCSFCWVGQWAMGCTKGTRGQQQYMC
mmetsp:Transcript_19256/g.41632  ORF Transcript_19256/g.41632 Transcript_19256/m.41632 type:complete len:98 (+) Transcript_19256:575-868(+)